MWVLLVPAGVAIVLGAGGLKTILLLWPPAAAAWLLLDGLVRIELYIPAWWAIFVLLGWVVATYLALIAIMRSRMRGLAPTPPPSLAASSSSPGPTRSRDPISPTSAGLVPTCAHAPIWRALVAAKLGEAPAIVDDLKRILDHVPNTCIGLRRLDLRSPIFGN